MIYSSDISATKQHCHGSIQTPTKKHKF